MGNIPPDIGDEVYNLWGDECIICNRTPDITLGLQAQGITKKRNDKHHLNGRKEDNRVLNLIPLCSSCHTAVHRNDDPPYRFFHRLLDFDVALRKRV